MGRRRGRGKGEGVWRGMCVGLMYIKLLCNFKLSIFGRTRACSGKISPSCISFIFSITLASFPIFPIFLFLSKCGGEETHPMLISTLFLILINFTSRPSINKPRIYTNTIVSQIPNSPLVSTPSQSKAVFTYSFKKQTAKKKQKHLHHFCYHNVIIRTQPTEQAQNKLQRRNHLP